MTTVNEAISNSKPPLGSELAAGVDFLSAKQQITFTLYKRLVLPLDGFIFWVRYDLVSPIPIQPGTVIVQGSLHYSTETEQEEDSTSSLNTIVFTALSPCDIFNQISPQFLYLANYRGIRFAFNSQGKYYQQADLWHYVGNAYKSIHGTQIIDDITTLNSLKQIVSNSLPIWLAMSTYVPPYPGFICPITNMFPSFLVPENETPPYASIHIEDTKALAETAYLGSTLTSTQLSSETVRITTYGVNNDDIITFLNFVTQYSLDWGYIGIMNMPIISDLKEIQSEIQVISQKKIIEFKISYYQTSVRNIVRQLIEHALVKSTIHLGTASVTAEIRIL